MQKQAYDEDVQLVESDLSCAIVVVDFSRLGLDDRKEIPMLGVEVIQGNNGKLHRLYFDFAFGSQNACRPALTLYSILALQYYDVFRDVSTIKIWSDACGAEFRTAKALWGLSFLSVHLSSILWSWSFFAPRHGTNDVDRHFGRVEQRLTRQRIEHSDVWIDDAVGLAVMEECSNTTAINLRDQTLFNGDEGRMEWVKGRGLHLARFLHFEAIAKVGLVNAYYWRGCSTKVEILLENTKQD